MSKIIETFFSNPFKKKLNKDKPTIEFLQNILLFKDLSLKELTKLEIICQPRIYQDKEDIFKEGDPSAVLYLVKSGEVKIFPSKIKPEKIHIILKENDFFGDIGFLDEEPRIFNAQSIGKSELLGIFRLDFFDFIKKNPVTGNKILLNLNEALALKLKEIFINTVIKSSS